MYKFINWTKKMLLERKGATMVEYSVLIALISVAAIAVIALIGPQLVNAWTAVNTALTNAGF